MRLVLTCLLLLATEFLSSCGHQLRGPLDIPDPPIVGPKHEIQMNTLAGKISALKVKSVAAANDAQAAAALAGANKLSGEEIYVKAMAVGPEIVAIKKVAKAQALAANEASKETIKSFKSLQARKKSLVAVSKTLAVQEVKDLLKEKYHELAEWRHKVLRNPWEESQYAAQKAAAPYFKMMGSYAASMNGYGLEAGAMRSGAAAAAANAKALESGVEAKKEAGDVVAAAQDLEMSKALEIQSKQLSARAGALDGAVSEMRNVVPQFASAAHMAAWNGMYSANPDSVPPPPVDPNFAYNSPV